MDDKSTVLFDNWHDYIQKMSELYERLGSLFTDLGIAKVDVRIITFISSVRHGEIRYYDSSGTLCGVPHFLETSDKQIVEEFLAKLFDIKIEQSIFTFVSQSEHIDTYDEFGVVHQKYEDFFSYGIIIEYPNLGYSKIIFELLKHISAYCMDVLHNEKFEIEEYMLANIVYVALKKQIDIDFYNTLAANSYEKRVASGGILLMSGMPQGDLQIHFHETYPLEVKNVKQIRKLLEMTTEELFLISKNGQVMGLGNSKDVVGDFELFIFNGHQRWSYYKNDQELLSYKEGKYTYIFDNSRNFILNFPRHFISYENYRYLNAVLHEIRQKKRGTVLIITDDAQSEVERLCKFGRGYAIDPVDFKNKNKRSLLSSIILIDGAIFIDTNFLCYGVGVILDGIAVNAGLSSRGARYNSAQCYIDNQKHGQVTAVVVSDDETIDILYNEK